MPHSSPTNGCGNASCTSMPPDGPLALSPLVGAAPLACAAPLLLAGAQQPAGRTRDKSSECPTATPLLLAGETPLLPLIAAASAALAADFSAAAAAPGGLPSANETPLAHAAFLGVVAEAPGEVDGSVSSSLMHLPTAEAFLVALSSEIDL